MEDPVHMARSHHKVRDALSYAAKYHPNFVLSMMLMTPEVLGCVPINGQQGFPWRLGSDSLSEMGRGTDALPRTD